MNFPFRLPLARASLLAALALAACAPGVSGAAPLPRLQVSDNHRFLVTADGKPFFWLGDTAWELFHRLDREDAATYLRNRAERRFNLVQAVALAELDGLNDPNPTATSRSSTTTPPAQRETTFTTSTGSSASANELGIYIGCSRPGATSGTRSGAPARKFHSRQRRTYGEWLGRRYRNAGVVWMLGGDRKVDNDAHKDITRAMARGLRQGDGGAHLMTWHPTGGNSSSQHFTPMTGSISTCAKTGTSPNSTAATTSPRADYDRTPVKPVLDGEPIYEDHPVSFDAKKLGHSIAADVRRPLYWDLFNGAFGHTYGHHSVWQMWTPSATPSTTR
jgi:hypothetical protein